MSQIADSGPLESTSTSDAPAVLSLEANDVVADVDLLAAIGSETRYVALRLIAEADGEICVCELEPALAVSQGAVSQALSRLFAAGLVTRRKDGRWRYYSTTPTADNLLGVLDECRGTDDE